MNEILIGTVPAVITGILTFILSRKKQAQETKSNELDNVQKALEVYRQIIQDLKTDLQETQIKVEDLNRYIDEIRKKCNKNCIIK
jgi:peptidoglycan hydrolase CwlO-like protein